NSLLQDPSVGWGWLADRGFDIIQTDWLMQCDTYLKQTGRRK
ncbi:MAG: glycerophosphodiester phosphodiesterase, partial [Clostridia bacterium]|nr:glycerophosphodiester phosphodiesterase [Clostridia bacterium]